MAKRKKIRLYRVHPLCALFPQMDEDARRALRTDMEANGQREPITLHEDQILDGRNRYDICKELGLKPKTRVWDGKGKLVDFVVSMNLNRRHLDTSQRAMIAAELAKQSIQSGAAPNGAEDGLSLSDTARAMNVSDRAVDRASTVVESGAPELSQAVKDGDVSVSLAAQAAQALPTQAQIKALRQAERTGESPSKVLKEAVDKAAPKKKSKQLSAEEIKAQIRALRSGKQIVTVGMRKEAVKTFGRLVRWLDKMKLKERLTKQLEAINEAIKTAT